MSRFPVNADGTLGTPATFAIPKVNGHSALVGQIRYSPDGFTVYAAINGQNSFFQVRTSTGDAPNPLWQFDASVDLLTPIHAE